MTPAQSAPDGENVAEKRCVPSPQPSDGYGDGIDVGRADGSARLNVSVPVATSRQNVLKP